MTSVIKVNRRDFIKTTTAGATGLLLAVSLPEQNQLEAQFPPPPREAAAP